MKLNRHRELHAFLSTYFANSDMEFDEETTKSFLAASSGKEQDAVITQAKALLADPEFPVEELGSEANRWFGDADEGRAWFKTILAILESAQTGSSITVKDSNGTVLAEGDSVLVIKDLKVKGGSSDLKRGTMIRKIHLIDDAENVECRVDGSTLVLKTCFLKKA